MRLVGLVWLLAGGCTADLGFAPDGILDTATHGVVLRRTGQDAHAGMRGTTCSVHTRTGAIGYDIDFTGDAEEPQDAGRGPDGQDVVVVVASDGVHLLPDVGLVEEVSMPDVARRDVLQARLVGDGVVVLTEGSEGCGLTWPDGSTVGIDACAEAEITADADLGVTWVAGPEGVLEATPWGEVDTVAEDADLAVWDAFAAVLYVARAGETWVRGLGEGGDLLWETDLGAPVVDLDDRGWREGALVLADDGASGQIWLVDARTGEASLEQETPSGAHSVTVSENGRSYALVTAEQVVFLEVERHHRE